MILVKKTVDFSGCQTQTAKVAGEHADHQTTTTASAYCLL